MWKSLTGLTFLAIAAGCSSSGGDGAITGAGATFPYPLYTKWIAEYSQVAPGVAINYQSIGSGGGIRQVTERTVDFGATDAPMTDEQLAKARDMLHIPTCIGAVAIAYNLQGVGPGLKLRPDTIAGIFLGQIQKWDDPKITADNPGEKLPSAPIATVHRSDGSGTTKLFLDYLSRVSPAWEKGPGTGTSIAWPSGIGAKGNEGVAAQIKSQPASIGYVEIAYAVQNKMSVAQIRNRAGQFVTPTLESTTAAARGIGAKLPEDLRVSLVDADGEDAYPIAGFTFILLRSRQTEPERGRALVGFLTWALQEGQSFAADLHYAPLPAEVAEKAIQRLAKVQGPDNKPLL